MRSARDAKAQQTQTADRRRAASRRAAGGAFAQAPSAACRAPQFAQFGFWLGEWTVRWTDKDKRELAGQWKQTWVDQSGSCLDFEGKCRDGRMILSRRAPLLGANVQQRMIFSDIGPDALTWDWQISTDNGATWSTRWRLRYTRRN